MAMMSKTMNRFLSACLLVSLAGCSATHSDLADSSLPKAPVSTAQAPSDGNIQKDTAATAAGENETLFIPSQLGYSIDLLNENNDQSQYPAIVALSEKDPALLTPEERDKLEAELLKLNENAKK